MLKRHTPSFWRRTTTTRERALTAALAPAALLVGEAAMLRHALIPSARAGVPVVCVGNLTVGGAGKTPVALALGAWFSAAGRTPHFISRGYGGRTRGPLRVDPERHRASEVGDEALLLARAAPTWVARNRLRGARAAAAAGADVVILDDGFQNPWLHKDLSLIVIDGKAGFGNGRVMPAGPLRERPEEALVRADALVLIGADETRTLERLTDPELPLLGAELVPAAGAEGLRGARIAAFAGIGNPDKFFATLEAMGCELAARHAFADHFPYSRADIEGLAHEAQGLNALLVTTEKDAVRLPEDLRARVTTLPVRLAWNDEALLASVLAPVLKTGARR